MLVISDILRKQGVFLLVNSDTYITIVYDTKRHRHKYRVSKSRAGMVSNVIGAIPYNFYFSYLGQLYSNKLNIMEVVYKIN